MDKPDRSPPREPTDAMIAAALFVDRPPGAASYRQIWEAMLDAAPVPAPPAEPPKPDGYFYETDGYFGVHRSFSDEYYNGRKPDRVIPYWLAPPVAAPAAPAEAPRRYEWVACDDCGQPLHTETHDCSKSLAQWREHERAAAPAEAPQGDDLVARLHSDADAWERHQDDYGDVVRIEREAAARIESDARHIRELEAEIAERAKRGCGDVRIARAADGSRTYTAECEALRAELATSREHERANATMQLIRENRALAERVAHLESGIREVIGLLSEQRSGDAFLRLITLAAPTAPKEAT